MHNKSAHITKSYDEPCLSCKPNEKINPMQDEQKGFIGKLNDEDKDYRGPNTTDAFIQNKSPNYKKDSITSLPKTYAINPQKETIGRHNEEFNSPIKSQLNKEHKYSRKRGHPKSIFKPEIRRAKEPKTKVFCQIKIAKPKKKR